MDVKPSELEMQVLSVLWESSPLTVRQIMERLPDGKQRAYTTVLTVMQGMTRKKLVTHEKQGTSYAYRPAVEQGPVVQPVMQALLRNVFGGDPRQVVQALLDSTSVSANDLDEIRKLIDSAAENLDGGEK
ncbi:MAG: BlaI/MecI/CopY family transcriptional regulator [Planctomycetaceae bacterium]|nr:BlaI/MecI/CopY family transcriptional regulator [Planctomycetaceae bacterium]